MKEIVERLAKLIDVKSAVTLLFTFVACYLAIKGRFDINDIYLMIISFYFGTQAEKKNSEKKGE